MTLLTNRGLFKPKYELVILNDDFLAMQPWADPTVPNGWLKSGTHDENSYVEEVATGMHMYSSSALCQIYKSGLLTVGKTYKIQINCTEFVSGFWAFVIGGVSKIPIDAIGLFELTLVVESANIGIKRGSGRDDDVTIRSIKIIEL